MTLLTQLQTLETSGLVRLAQIQPEREYLFRHTLVQDAAYQSLVKADRRMLHRVIGEVLERDYAERLDELASVLGHHFCEGDDHARALKYLTRAGDVAARKYANAEAAMHYTRALDIARQNPELQTATTVQQLFSRLGRVLELQGRYDLALANYAAMLGLAQQHHERTLELAALVCLTQIHSTPNAQFDAAQAQALSEQAVILARELNDREAEAKIWGNLVNLAMFTNRISDGVGYGERSIALARELGLREQLAFALNDIWRAYIVTRQMARARAAVEEASVLWRELGNLPMLTDSLTTLGAIQMYLGEYEEAVATSHQALQLSQAIRNLWGESNSQSFIGHVYWDWGESERALTTMEASLSLAERAGFVVPLWMTRAEQALVYGSLGAVARGIALAQEAVAVTAAHFKAFREWPLGALTRLLVWHGDVDAAQTMLTDAYANLRQDNSWAVIMTLQADGEWSLAKSNAEHALRVADDLLAYVTRLQVCLWRPDTLYVKGKALLMLERYAEARETLMQARAEAQALNSRRILWQILLALAEIAQRYDHEAEAHALRDEARALIAYIAMHTPDELRDSFLNLPQVRAVLE